MKSRRSGRRRRRLGGATVLRILVAGLAAAFVGWWALKAAVVAEFAGTNPFLAETVAPGDPRAVLRRAMYEFSQRGGRVSPATMQRALAALDRSALADEPFLLAAVAAAAAHDEAREEALLTESRRRNPRSRFTRLLLLDLYVRHGRSYEAGIEVAALSRLIPGAGGALVPELGRLARDPGNRPGLARMLRENPEIRDDTLAYLAAHGADTALLLSLAAASGSGADPAHPPQWQGALLDRLVAAGDIEGAYRLWRAAAHVPAEAARSGVYDPNFAGAPGALPFNWQLTSDAEGVAERGRGGLQVDYYGRAPHLFARQLLLLRPGTYRLQMRVEGDAKGDGTQLAWTIACLGGKAPLLQLPLKDVDSAPKALAADFTVPAGCAAQWLRLDGSAGDVAAEQNVTITTFAIAAKGGR